MSRAMSTLRLRTAVLLAASVCALAAACTTTAEHKPPPLVPASAMDKLLPNADKVSDITGASVTELKTLEQFADPPPTVSDTRCQELTQVAGKTAYANSGSTAIRQKLLGNTDSAMLQQQGFVSVDQAVVLFPSTQQASAFVTATSKSWPACANKQITVSEPKLKEFHVPTQMSMSIGQVSDNDGILNARISSSTVIEGGTRVTNCQHLLTAENNVVIDVSACSGKIADNAPPPPPQAANAGFKIVHEIAEYIDNQNVN
jgi:PknH-like extracellular domain